MTTPNASSDFGAARLIDFERQLRRVENGLGAAFAEALRCVLEPALAKQQHGDFARWSNALESVPWPTARVVELNCEAPRVEFEALTPALNGALESLMPWRKGPFQLGALNLQAEWNSALKWERFASRIEWPGLRVLDVGAGNGYFTLRAAGAGAAFTLGIDPGWLSNAQWALLQRLFQCEQAALLPMRLADLPVKGEPFDVVLSMGVIYHQRDPLGHLANLRQLLRPGGQLVLETLVIDEPGSTCLVPADRYASMRNVWFLPSPTCARNWLLRCGFAHAEMVDLTPTTAAEQRPSPWLRAPSLADFLDPTNPKLTIEGHPAPLRAVFLAR